MLCWCILYVTSAEDSRSRMKGKGVYADSFADADVFWLLIFVVSVQWLKIDGELTFISVPTANG